MAAATFATRRGKVARLRDAIGRHYLEYAGPAAALSIAVVVPLMFKVTI